MPRPCKVRSQIGIKVRFRALVQAFHMHATPTPDQINYIVIMLPLQLVASLVYKYYMHTFDRSIYYLSKLA